MAERGCAGLHSKKQRGCKLKNKHIAIVRWILSGILLCGIFTETGPWTTISMGLIIITFEIKEKLKKKGAK